ncbi:MAG TPA: HD domain-containing phosphohydrolase [Gammaproteobacteria bacterium]|nr:HD domain-containing phosphohydrolase [Gammaproteobacteria bacterium]
MPQHHDQHWIRSVTELGDRHAIIAQRDIHAEGGMKLVARGARVHSGMRERLLQHKLLIGLEHAARIENAVGPAQIRRATAQLRDADPVMGAILAGAARQLAPLELLLEVPVPNAIAFKLTVAREQRPALFTHSVVTAAISLFLAVETGWNRPAVVRTVTAALAHDIGELHLDPKMFRSDHRFDDSERRALHSHPLAASLILKDLPDLHPAVRRAILEHHERLDGSGYPHGLSGAAISPIGRLLAVAEVTASRFDEDGLCRDPQSMGTLLKLNSHKLDPRFAGLLAPVYRRPLPAVIDEELVEPVDLGRRLRAVAELFQQWEEATAAQAGRDAAALEGEVFDFITEQVWALRTQLLDAGFNPREPDTVLELVAEDAAFLGEVADLLDEALWQLDSLAREVVRRWPEVLSQLGSECPLLRWLGRAREARSQAGSASVETDLALEDLNGPAA